MGYRYWTIVRKRTEVGEGPGTGGRQQRRHDVGPQAGPLDDRLPLATAVPLWGVFSMLGWLMIAYAAVYLSHVAPRLLATDSRLVGTATAAAAAPAAFPSVGHPRR